MPESPAGFNIPAEVEIKVPQPVRKVLPYIALGLGISALSMSALFVRWADAPGVVTSFYRMFIAAVVMFPFFLRHTAVKRGKGLPVKWVIFPLLSGLFNSLDHAIWSTALSHTSVANATLLNNISPLWVALFAFFIWKEKLSKKFWAGLGLALVGVMVIFGNDVIANPHLGFGDLLGISSSFFYAGFYLATQQGRKHYHVLPYWWMVTVCCCAFLLSYLFIIHIPLAGYSRSTFLTFLMAALISQVIGNFSLTYALGCLPASVVAPTMILQPVLTALLAIPLASEALLPAQWLGGAVVLAGIYLVNRY